MFSDVLPCLISLSHAFQREDMNFTVVRPLVNGTKAAINAHLVSPSEHFQNLPSVLADMEEYGAQTPSDSQVRDLCTVNIFTLFLSILHTDFRM